MNVSLRQLRAFIAGAQSASFSEAAEKINLTQPGYSLIIRQLEEEVGLRLFDRTTRRLGLTSEGLEFSHRIERILHDLDEACQDLKDRKELRRGRVTVAVLPSAASSVVPSVLRSLAGKYPGLSVTILERLAGPLIESVASGEADFGFGINIGMDRSLTFTPLFNDRLVCLLPTGHRLAAGPEVTWDDLEVEPYVCFVESSSLQYHVAEVLARRQMTLLPVSEVSYMTTAVSLVQSGIGFTILPELALSSLNLKGVAIKPIADPLAQRKLGMITLTRRTRGPAVLAALDAFQRGCQVALQRDRTQAGRDS